MRFILTDNTWILDNLTAAEWQLLRDLPLAASGESFRTSPNDPLYPPPVVDSNPDDAETAAILSDWSEFVHPELRQGMTDAREIVAEDLQQVEFTPNDEESDENADKFSPFSASSPQFRRLTVKLDHCEQWYSTLNQARLQMNTEYKIAHEQDRWMEQAKTLENIDPDRLLVLAQYEIYTAIQSVLIEHVMKP